MCSRRGLLKNCICFTKKDVAAGRAGGVSINNGSSPPLYPREGLDGGHSTLQILQIQEKIQRRIKIQMQMPLYLREAHFFLLWLQEKLIRRQFPQMFSHGGWWGEWFHKGTCLTQQQGWTRRFSWGAQRGSAGDNICGMCWVHWSGTFLEVDVRLLWPV